MSPKKQKPRALVVVAHPDDEALFFAGLILAKKKYQWTIVCATDGNADGMGAQRHQQFITSCKALGAKAVHWNLPDVFDQNLDTDELSSRLLTLEKPSVVFTHGILGEYGHAHHQDVSYAVHKTFSKITKVYSVAYNIRPELTVHLSPELYAKKQKILWHIYGSETKRLLNFLPATFSEGFTRVCFDEVKALYRWLRQRQNLTPKSLKVYGWLYEYLREGGGRLNSRPF